MLSKKNIVIILDANILNDVVGRHNSRSFSEVIKRWLTHVVENMKCPPKGKRVTLAATTKVLRDYETGLIRDKHRDIGKVIVDSFKRSISSKYGLDDEGKTTFSFRMFSPSKKPTNATRDRYDRQYSSLIESALDHNPWRDYFVIVATRDFHTREDLERATVGCSRIRIEDSIKSLEEVIEC